MCIEDLRVGLPHAGRCFVARAPNLITGDIDRFLKARPLLFGGTRGFTRDGRFGSPEAPSGADRYPGGGGKANDCAVGKSLGRLRPGRRRGLRSRLFLVGVSKVLIAEFPDRLECSSRVAAIRRYAYFVSPANAQSRDRIEALATGRPRSGGQVLDGNGCVEPSRSFHKPCGRARVEAKPVGDFDLDSLPAFARALRNRGRLLGSPQVDDLATQPSSGLRRHLLQPEADPGRCGGCDRALHERCFTQQNRFPHIVGEHLYGHLCAENCAPEVHEDNHSVRRVNLCDRVHHEHGVRPERSVVHRSSPRRL